MTRGAGRSIGAVVSWSAAAGRSRAVGALLAAAAMAAFAVSRQPQYAVVGVLAIAGASVAAGRLWLAVSLLVASFYFEGYLAVGVGYLTVIKLIGALAMGAWFLAWSSGRQPVVTVRLFWPVAALAAWLLLSSAMAYDQAAAVLLTSRYLMFFALIFLVVQTVDGHLARATQLAAIATAAAAVAALIGLLNFLVAGTERAGGPISDPNDFAFLLAVTAPLALHQAHTARHPAWRVAAALALGLILAGTLATFSRSGIVALLVGGAWSLLTGRLRSGWLLLLVIGGLVLVLSAWLLQTQTVSNALTRKQHIAQSNVDQRLVAWRIALAEYGSSPLLRVGPGNFNGRFIEFGLPAAEGGPITTHNAYLNILAELGLPGLLLFLGYLAMSWAVLRRRIPDDPVADGFQSALAAGFIMALVGSLFLTEQYYAPLWLLPALGATLVRERTSRSEAMEPVG
jgi:putative inorganic carbon (HCO3(-)) transporter